MIESEVFLLVNNLQLYNKLQELNLLESVTEIMQSFIEGEKESYELGIQDLTSDNIDLENEVELLKFKILRLSAPKENN
jgi:hypothetical protein